MSEFLSAKNRKIGALGNILLAGFLSPGVVVTERPSNGVQPNQVTVSASKEFGVMSDMAEADTLKQSETIVNLVRQAGFNALKETVWIDTGNQGLGDLDPKYQNKISNSLQAATEAGLPVDLALEQHAWVRVRGKRYTPPYTPSLQRGFCRVGAELVAKYPIIESVSVGFEPNNDAFWWPQYVNGRDAVARPYVSLLGICYDILKAARPDNPPAIIGGELAPSGNDSPQADGANHSPVSEITNMCEIYADNRRTRPIMDALSIHWYPAKGETTVIAHPNSTNRGVGDYGTLMQEAACFNVSGKDQPVPKLIFAEGGLPTIIPNTEQYRYDFDQPLTTSVDEQTAGNYIAEAIRQVCQQPNTLGIYNFQLIDDRSALDTGFYYPPPDRRQTSTISVGLKAKDTLKPVKKAIQNCQ